MGRPGGGQAKVGECWAFLYDRFVNILSKCQVPNSSGLGVKVFWRYFHKGSVSLTNSWESKTGGKSAHICTLSKGGEGGPTWIQIVWRTFFCIDLDISQGGGGGGFDPNPKTFEALFCLNLELHRWKVCNQRSYPLGLVKRVKRICSPFKKLVHRTVRVNFQQ